MGQIVLKMEHINKSFGAAKVLKDVGFELKEGEVHALVGGNGAGKSTLMKIMTGVYSKDSGDMFLRGEPVEIKDSIDAKKHGIGMIFQEMSLVGPMTVAENIFLGDELKNGPFRDVAEMNKKAKEALARLGLDIDPSTPVSNLTVGMMQMVEITKAVSKNANILVFDEPSAALSDSETKRLFEIIRQLKKEGVSMVYISHRMQEILEVCDRVSILKDGCNVATEDVENLTMEKIVNLMLGGASAGKKFEWIEREYDKNGADILSVEHLAVDERVKDISFSLKKGEILGLAGLMGSGRTEIMESLFGIRKMHGGNILLEGKPIKINNPTDAIDHGFALVPEDRRREGLVLIHSVRENAILPVTKRLTKGIFNDKARADAVVEKNIKDLGVVTDNMNKIIGLLSGGNQQKVVVAKWLNSDPKIFMFDEPTAGVDIGAKSEIIAIIRKFADEGGSVIFASSELAEMMAVCDRIITLYDGRITGEIMRKDIKEEEELQRAIQER